MCHDQPRFGRRTGRLTFAVALGLALFGMTSPGAAQDKPQPKKYEALEDLLKELKTPTVDDKPRTEAKPAAEAKKDESKPKDIPKDQDKPKGSADPKETPKTKSESQTKGEGSKTPAKGEEVETKDKALDSLLEKLGTTEDAPSREERPRAGGGQPDPKEPEKGAGQDPKDDPAREKSPRSGGAERELTGKEKQVDDHLEELSGVRRKRKKQDEGKEGGALSEVVKGMRDVEQRLSKTDTGDETRKRQQQIVKKLDTLIEQMKSQSQSQGGKKQLAMNKGQQPGQQPGQEPGSTPGGAPSTKPQRPTGQRSLAGGKDEWGHLPPELRQELENVFKEEPLPAREELIRRYYLSVSKKSLKRGE